MKNILLLLSLIILSCNLPKPKQVKEYIVIDPFAYEEDSIPYLSNDSILKIADKAMKDLELKKEIRKGMMEQIQKQLKNEELTKGQIQVLQQQSVAYEAQIKDHLEKQIINRDTIIYHIQYRDTIICKPVYVPDTIIVEVLDTIKVKKLKKKRNR